jgi:hypothetical protein
MNGGRYIAKERGIIEVASVRRRVEKLTKEKPWVVVKNLSSLDEADRKSLKWVLAKV